MLPRIRKLLLTASVLISIYYLGSALIFRLQLDDMRRIDSRYLQFREAILEERYDDAYASMSPEYRQDHCLGRFVDDFSGVVPPPLYPQRSLSIRLRTATLMPEYDRFGPFFQSGLALEWEKISGEWYLTGEINRMLD